MVNIILVDKSGDLKICKYNIDKGDELYKKCKFKKQENFEKRTTWKTKKSKYDFPPPVDTPLYFGVCALVANDENDDCIDLSIEAWETFYEELFGGFENLADTAAEDNNEEDELESIPAEMKTKSGYLKDDFVVEDNQVENGSTESDEEEYDDDSAELELEEYSYSDEEESN